MMKPVRASFLQPSQPALAHWLVATLIAIGAALLVARTVQLGKELQHLRAQVQPVGTAGSETNNTRNEAAPKLYDRSARELMRDRELPWPEALVALESSPVTGVLLRALETDSLSKEVRIEVSSPDHSRLLKFMAELNEGQGHGGRDLSFSLRMTRVETDGTVSGTLVLRRFAGIAEAQPVDLRR